MTTADGRPTDPPDADARFAAYLTDVAAKVDDPRDGDVYRMILDDDPREQRALFDLVEELIAHPIPPPASLPAIAFVLFVVTALAFVAVRHLL
ncbi:MAG: hypothetical protein JXA67_13050 [Micromonosporaceae bacterium]|nr:hypothetical protein [Micromonosporaceae bacterium]